MARTAPPSLTRRPFGGISTAKLRTGPSGAPFFVEKPLLEAGPSAR